MTELPARLDSIVMKLYSHSEILSSKVQLLFFFKSSDLFFKLDALEQKVFPEKKKQKSFIFLTRGFCKYFFYAGLVC